MDFILSYYYSGKRMANLCIIPARGGSKRIPRKNIKDFFGKPIIAYSIQVALECELFDEVMVSTDDNEIAEIAEQYGASVPFIRSEKKSDDFASTMDVIFEVLSIYKQKLGIKFQYICCIYPAAPLTQAKHIVEGFKKLTDCNLSSVLPVVAYSYPVWRGIEIDDELFKKSMDMQIRLNIPNAIFFNNDFYDHSVTGFDIVFVYPDEPMRRGLEKKLLNELTGKLIHCGHHFHPQELNKEDDFLVNGTLVTIYTK